MHTLWDLKPAQSAVVSANLNENPIVVRRLNDLGFSVSMRVACVEALPMGGPKCFITSMGEYALDREVTELIRVTELLDIPQSLGSKK